MAYSAQRALLLANRQIMRLGGRKGALRRAGVDRPVNVRVMRYTAREAQGRMLTQVDRRALIAALDVKIAPDPEEDTLILYKPGTTDVDKELKITLPPEEIEVSGTVIMWDATVQGA